MKTKVFVEDFRGQKIIGFWEVDDTGKKAKEYPELSFAGRKAAMLMEHIKELEAFSNEWKATPPSPKAVRR